MVAWTSHHGTWNDDDVALGTRNKIGDHRGPLIEGAFIMVVDRIPRSCYRSASRGVDR